MLDDQVIAQAPEADAARPSWGDEQPTPEAGGDSPRDGSGGRSDLWQVPTIVASLALIGAGLYVASQRQPRNDFDGALDQVRELIADGRLDPARHQLTEIIEPNLAESTDVHRARFHALQGDWIAAFQRSSGARTPENDRSIATEYERAAELGLSLSPQRLEQWALALVTLGELEPARRRLQELEALSLAAGAEAPARHRRNRVLRALIERSLTHGGGSFETLMDVLTRYRADELIGLEDQLWATAREAELRLANGRYGEAVDRLLIDSRRLERRAREAGETMDFAEVHTLLGQGYYHLGRHDYARHHLEQVLEIAESSNPTRGVAQLVLGHLAVAADRLEEASVLYDDVVRDFPGTASELPARLGRAELRGVLGDHEASLEELRVIRDVLDRTGGCCGVDASRVNELLLDRASAAIAAGRLALALEHLTIADSLFDPELTPGTVLLQIAAVHRQMADRRLAEAGVAAAAGGAGMESVAPAIRHEAQRHYREAGDALVRHLRATVGAPGGDDAWAASLWQAADCYDLAGETERAVKHYREYLAGRSDDDPRRPPVLRGLGRTLHALGRYEEAAEAYTMLVQQHPRTNEAYGSLVPLARVQRALGQPAQARQLLQEVVAGQRGLSPEALEYRDALFELGRLLNADGDAVAAIERLAEAVTRYPDDERIDEIRYLLADSYRRHARDLQAELDEGTLVTGALRAQLQSDRRAALRTAASLYAEVKSGLGSVDPRRLDWLEHDLLRYSFQYEADCVFALGDVEQAIGLYEQVVRQYPEHHASMNALVQIVNCYTDLGDGERARLAHERAMARLARLPDEAFESSDALLDRAAWERWLANRPLSAVN